MDDPVVFMAEILKASRIVYVPVCVIPTQNLP